MWQPGTYLIFLIRDMYYIGSSVPPSSGGERRWSLRERRLSEHVRGSEIDSLFLFLRAIFRGMYLPMTQQESSIYFKGARRPYKIKYVITKLM
jgi:hypothetical protein